MPFQSEKQRRYLHANHPEIAKRWEEEYATGGIANHFRKKFKEGSYSRSYNPGAGGVVQHGPVKTNHTGGGGGGGGGPPSVVHKPKGPTAAEIAAAKAAAAAKKKAIADAKHKDWITKKTKEKKEKIKKFKNLVDTKGYDSTIATDEETQLYDDWYTATGKAKKATHPVLINSESIQDFREKDGKTKTFITDKSSIEDLITGDINKSTYIETPELGSVHTILTPETAKGPQSWAVNPGEPRFKIEEPKDKNVFEKWGDHARFSETIKNLGNTKNYHQIAALDFMNKFNVKPETAKKLAKGYQHFTESVKAAVNPFDDYTFDKAKKRAETEAALNALGIDAYGKNNELTEEYATFTPAGTKKYLNKGGIANHFKFKDGGTPRQRFWWGGNPNEDRAAEESHANEFAGIDSGGWDPGVSSPGTTSSGGNVNTGGGDQEDDVAQMMHDMSLTPDHSPDWTGSDRGWVVSEDEETEIGGADYIGPQDSVRIHNQILDKHAHRFKPLRDLTLDQKARWAKDRYEDFKTARGFFSIMSGPLGWVSAADTIRKAEIRKQETIAELKTDIQTLTDLGYPTHHHTVDTLIQSLNQEILDMTQPKPQDEDTGGDGPTPLVVPAVMDEMAAATGEIDMFDAWDRIKRNQAIFAARQSADDTKVGEWVGDQRLLVNSGGLANLFRVKNRN